VASGNGSSGIGETAVVEAAGADDPRVVPPRPLPTRVRGEWCWVWCTGAWGQIYRRRNATGPRCFGPSRGGAELNPTPLGGL
jgi:hypothetical protein